MCIQSQEECFCTAHQVHSKFTTARKGVFLTEALAKFKHINCMIVRI